MQGPSTECIHPDIIKEVILDKVVHGVGPWMSLYLASLERKVLEMTLDP